MTFQRYAKYEVMKLDDIDRYLSSARKQDLQNIVQVIQMGRIQDGKPACNSYVVVNQDQPYAEIVWKLIELEETRHER